MVRRLTTINVDDDLIQKAKGLNQNVSEICRNALSKALNMQTEIDIQDVINDIKLTKIQIEDTIKGLEEKQAEILQRIERREKYIKEKYIEIPECQNLTIEQLKNPQIMMGLVDLLRQKYPESRASVKEIQEYYEMIE